MHFLRLRTLENSLLLSKFWMYSVRASDSVPVSALPPKAHTRIEAILRHQVDR